MSRADQRRYVFQHDRLCEIVTGRMGMKVSIEQRDGPYWVNFKVFENEGPVRVTASVEELEHMSDGEIATSIRARMRRP